MPAKITFPRRGTLPVQEDVDDLVTRLQSGQPDNWLEVSRTGTNDWAFIRVGSVAHVEGPSEGAPQGAGPNFER